MLVLKRRLTFLQWFALILLFLGIIFVNVRLEKRMSFSSTEFFSGDTFLGISAVVVCALTSSFAGIWCEKLLKKDGLDIFVVNVQIAFMSIFISAAVGLITKRDVIFAHGPFYGFSPYAWAYITLSAFNGITNAFVFKYADNILKSFATAISIILTSLLSFLLFSFIFTPLFLFGASIVMGSLILYNFPPDKKY